MAYTCRQCRHDLYLYVRRELKPRRRQLVAKHLDSCMDCYAEYRRMRIFDSDLGAGISRLGTPSSIQLAHVWAGVEAQLARPVTRRAFHMRYGVAVALVVMSLLVPRLFGHQPVMAVPYPPTPQEQSQPVTYPARTIAMVTPQPEAIARRPLYTLATPGFEHNNAPELSATEPP